MPCYAIVASGGYKDDKDEGEVLDYTGEGQGEKDVSFQAKKPLLRLSLTLLSQCQPCFCADATCAPEIPYMHWRHLCMIQCKMHRCV